MERRMSLSFNDKFYSRFQKKGEAIGEAVTRVDQEVIDNNFNWMCERDTLTSDMIINIERNSKSCATQQKTLARS
tara:strand:- start:126 stop:350 length:225 start_codon:yes stop_codon:yes gene_type:complete